jgi:hypothetical protein
LGGTWLADLTALVLVLAGVFVFCAACVALLSTGVRHRHDRGTSILFGAIIDLGLRPRPDR